MPHAYAPNTAVTQYQDRLAAQRRADEEAAQATPVGYVARYALKSREPEWAGLLNMGFYGFRAYSTNHLIAAQAALQDLGAGLAGDTHFTVAEQLARLETAIAARF